MDSDVPRALVKVSGTGRISANRTWYDPDQALQVIDDPETGEINSRAVIVMD